MTKGGLITASLKVFATYPNDNDELILLEAPLLGAWIEQGLTYPVGLYDLTSLYNSSLPIVLLFIIQSH